MQPNANLSKNKQKQKKCNFVLRISYYVSLKDLFTYHGANLVE